MESIMPGRAQLLEKLLGSEIKADLLTLFHKEPALVASLEEISEKIARDPKEVAGEVNDLVDLGLIKESRIISFDRRRDAELQASLSRELSQLTREEISQQSESPIHSGVPVLDDILPGGYPYPSVSLVLGDPATGKTSLINQYMANVLRQGSSVVYAALDDFPDSVRQSLQSFGVRIPDVESRGKLSFIDCYSHLVGSQSKEKYSEDPRMLSDLSIVISKALSNHAESGRVFLAIDSLTTILQKAGVRPTLDFIHVLVAKTRGYHASCLMSVARRAFHPAIVAALQDRVDGVVEMKLEEAETGIGRMIRILKMKGGQHTTTWIPYMRDQVQGLIKTAADLSHRQNSDVVTSF